jgi:phage-related minor tail protein
MEGSRIKGITIEIGSDTTKLQTALKGVKTENKSTQSLLKDVEKLLKLDPGNTELLAQKQKLLSDAVKDTKEKLETLKTAAEQTNTVLANGEILQEQYDALHREIVETVQELEKEGFVMKELEDFLIKNAKNPVVIDRKKDILIF